MAGAVITDYLVADAPTQRALPDESSEIAADVFSGAASEEAMLASGGSPALTTVRGEPDVGRGWKRELRELRELSDADPRTAFARVAEIAEKEEREAA